MKIKTLLLLSALMLSAGVYSQEYFEEDYPTYDEPMIVDEGSFDSEMQPPLSDDYYLSEEMERQEDVSYPEEDPEWSLEGEELPVDDYEDGY